VATEHDINWKDVIKKEARGVNDEDLGEVQEVGDTYVLVQKGLINKEKFYIPQAMVESYDDGILRFKISEEEIKTKYLGDSPPTPPPSTSTSTGTDKEQEEEEEEPETTRIPLVEEKLKTSKKEVVYKEATLIKEPVTETKTVEVPVTHEELIIERRPGSEGTISTSELKPPVTSKEEVKIPLKKEEVEVKKEPYVKEEVAVKKKPVTETRQVSEEVRSERVDVSGSRSSAE
jgi:uncharacterized protein (TIGR02271 family)